MYICKNNNYLELFPAFRSNLFFRTSKKRISTANEVQGTPMEIKVR